VISAVVVSYNSERWLDQCLRSLAGQVGEAIVVDNASADASARVAESAGARVLALERNAGFAAAANRGAAAARGDLILLLNPDAALERGLAELAARLEARPDCGAAAGVLVDRVTGKEQRGFSVRRFPGFWTLAGEVLGWHAIWPGNPLNRHYRCLDLPLDEAGEVDQPAGAFLLVKRRVWEELGGLDEAYYPLWFEDVDFCLRLRRAGLKILVDPVCRVRHEGGHSLESVGFRDRQLFWYRNLLYHVKKHLGPAAALGMRVLVCAGALARMLAAMFGGRSGAIRAYRDVIQLAVAGGGPAASAHGSKR
jgi:GT2 family glycosyltransferase